MHCFLRLAISAGAAYNVVKATQGKVGANDDTTPVVKLHQAGIGKNGCLHIIECLLCFGSPYWRNNVHVVMGNSPCT
jgi:hypothetical protein